MMQHKGYVGKVEFDDEANIFHGEVINTRDVITFQGQTVAELKKAFRESVDDYLAFCEARGEAPDHPFAGQFVTRIPPELHRRVNLAASLSGKSLNAWVSEKLESAIAQVGIDTILGKPETTKHRAMDELFEKLQAFLKGLGPDVEQAHRKSYDSFSRRGRAGRRIFTYVHSMKSYLRCNVALDLTPEDDFVVVHHGRINHRAIKICNERDLERAKPLLRKCYLSKG